MADPTPVQVVATGVAMWDAWGRSVDDRHQWYVGSATGGPAGNGLYPFRRRDGSTVMLPCRARMIADGVSAASVAFDPADSGLTATTLQAAIVELAGRLS